MVADTAEEEADMKWAAVEEAEATVEWAVVAAVAATAVEWAAVVADTAVEAQEAAEAMGAEAQEEEEVVTVAEAQEAEVVTAEAPEVEAVATEVVAAAATVDMVDPVEAVVADTKIEYQSSFPPLQLSTRVPRHLPVLICVSPRHLISHHCTSPLPSPPSTAWFYSICPVPKSSQFHSLHAHLSPCPLQFQTVRLTRLLSPFFPHPLPAPFSPFSNLHAIFLWSFPQHSYTPILSLLSKFKFPAQSQQTPAENCIIE